MPDLDGFAVCQALRRDPRSEHIPILIVTGLEDDQSVERAALRERCREKEPY